MARKPESPGSSSKSLTTLFWNLGNWKRGKNWLMPSFIDQDTICYKEEKPDEFPDHVCASGRETVRVKRHMFKLLPNGLLRYILYTCPNL